MILEAVPAHTPVAHSFRGLRGLCAVSVTMAALLTRSAWLKVGAVKATKNKSHWCDCHHVRVQTGWRLTVCGSCQLGFDEFVFVLLSRNKRCSVYRIKWAQSELISAAAAQLCHISRCSVLMEYFSHTLLHFFFHLLQTNQYPHSLAFHRKDYREMAIKGLASITSPISKPLKDSGSLGSGSGTRCPVTLQG